VARNASSNKIVEHLFIVPVWIQKSGLFKLSRFGLCIALVRSPAPDRERQSVAAIDREDSLGAYHLAESVFLDATSGLLGADKEAGALAAVLIARGSAFVGSDSPRRLLLRWTLGASRAHARRHYRDCEMKTIAVTSHRILRQGSSQADWVVLGSG